MRSRVEDRLMVIGKMWKEKRERLAHEGYYESGSGAYPTPLSSFQSQRSSRTTKMSEAMTKSFEKRLKDQLDKKEQLLTDLKKKYDEVPAELANNMRQQVSKKLIQQIQGEFEERLRYYEEMKRKKLEEKLS